MGATALSGRVTVVGWAARLDFAIGHRGREEEQVDRPKSPLPADGLGGGARNPLLRRRASGYAATTWLNNQWPALDLPFAFPAPRLVSVLVPGQKIGTDQLDQIADEVGQ